ncbi:hypothetical protein Tco_1561156 [Tanacetum coccineum]
MGYSPYSDECSYDIRVSLLGMTSSMDLGGSRFEERLKKLFFATTQSAGMETTLGKLPNAVGLILSPRSFRKGKFSLIVFSQEAYIKEALCSILLDCSLIPSNKHDTTSILSDMKLKKKYV